MADEMEAAGLGSLGGLSPGGSADLSGQPCRNCGELVDQRHCPRCGQLAASYHRPFITLVGESISDSLALDGRIARTLPLLFFRPGVLTRRYTEGKRARYVPPFRLFLLSSLIFYFVVFAFVSQVNWLDFASANVEGRDLTREEIAELRDLVIAADGEATEEQINEFVRRIQESRAPDAVDTIRAGAQSNRSLVDDIARGFNDGASDRADEGPAADDPGEAEPAEPSTEESDTPPPDVVAELPEIEERVERIIRDPRLFVAAIETWLPRLSLILVPLTMLTMALMYAWRRRVYIYDHAVHALNLHSWMYLAATVAILLGMLIGPGLASALFFMVLPVYVTFSLRGAYRSGIFTSFLRMCFLSFVWLIGVVSLGVAVVVTSALSV